MKRRAFLSGLAASIALASPALAEGVVDSIIRQLKRLGFDGIAQERTLLGRVRITADRKDGHREIIVNPRTGEILRDLWTPKAGEKGELAIIDDRRGRDDDDDDREEDDDDNSGKGGGGNSGSSDNSGSGSGGGGNSGSGGGDDDDDDDDD
jgi:uncharacterized membrane protein YgcG